MKIKQVTSQRWRDFTLFTAIIACKYCGKEEVVKQLRL